MAAGETYRSAFADPPGDNLAGIPTKGLVLSTPCISYGLPFDVACAKHVSETYRASAVYIISSGSLSSETNKVDRLVQAIGTDKVVGIKKGFTPHTPFSEILQVSTECRDLGADCVVTLGGGSITDGAKIVALVSLYSSCCGHHIKIRH